MPTYEYVCTECGERIEVFQRLCAEPLRVCTTCGGPLRKVFHPTGIVFKGSGFYSTDSRSTKKAKPARKAEESATKDASSEDSSKKEGGSEKSAAKEKTA